MTRRMLKGCATSLATACGLVAMLDATQIAGPTRVADAAMVGDHDTVRQLLQEGADVNATQNDGMTALHWAATHDDAELARMLLYAGANGRATTRLGGFTALHLASKAGYRSVIEAMLDAGVDPSVTTTTGVTPLMHAAASGDSGAVRVLLEGGADPDALESANGQTALMFAAARDRVPVVRLLVQRGADKSVTSAVVDVTDLRAPESILQENIRNARNERSAALAVASEGEDGEDGEDAQGEETGGEAPSEDDEEEDVAGVTRPFTFNELIGKQGGLTALHFAARQGATETVKTLLAHGADVNQVSPADGTSPLVIAIINGHYDLAASLLDHGADPTLATEAGLTPLYGVVNLQWAPRSFYPQPRAQLQQETGYLELMTRLLDRGADPNARLHKKIWFTEYNFGLLRMNDIGATPFWRAAHASDIAAMKLLVARGADPTIPTKKPASRKRPRQGGTRSLDDSKDHSGLPEVPTGGPGIPPLLAAAGVGYGQGFVGNAHRFAASGMLAAVTYLVEELGADVNLVDHAGNTAAHGAAARGDNAMIEYLVSRGADVTRVNRGGQTTVDMANGPVQRVEPYPETIALLEGLGAANNHKCISC